MHLLPLLPQEESCSPEPWDELPSALGSHRAQLGLWTPTLLFEASLATGSPASVTAPAASSHPALTGEGWQVSGGPTRDRDPTCTWRSAAPSLTRIPRLSGPCCSQWAPTAVARLCLRSALLPAPPGNPTAAAARPPPAPRGLWDETGKAPVLRWKPELSACLSFPPSILLLLLLLPLPPSLPLSLPPVGNSRALALQWDRQGKES